MKEIAEVGRKLLCIMREDAPHDGDERGNRYGKVVKHISGEERGRMSGEALLFAAELRLPRTPDFFFARLLGDEGVEGIKVNEPQSLHASTCNDAEACQARNVVEGHVDCACSVARSHIRDAVDDDFA